MQLIDLRPDISLLNPDFDGYKLSLTQIPTITEQLQVPVDRQIPDVHQYSLLHYKLYALHNHLVGESSESDNIYFVDKELNIQKYSVDAYTNHFSNITAWKIPQKERNSGDYNTSVKLVSDDFAAVADGVGVLYILDRSGENVDSQWKVIFSEQVIGPDEKFIVTDAVYKEFDKPQLHLLLTSVQQRGDSDKHSTVLHWITIEKSDSWNQVALRQLSVNGFVQYANLERSCKAIYIVSDASCRFILDSDNEIQQVEDCIVEKKYQWTQGREDITLKFPLSENDKSFVTIEAEGIHIKIKYREEVLLNGSLYQQIDPNLTCWTLENATLEVVLHKIECGLMWPEVVEGDRFGDYIPDPALVDEVAEKLAPMTSSAEVIPPSGNTFNSQQIEECDFESDKFTIFERLCVKNHNLTHKVNLGSHQVLLTVNLDRGLPLALALRSDVDACIWQPTITSGDFSLEHKGTLLALGYIQASKQQRKFFVCSPNFNYSAICESTKHVFIYNQNKSIGSTDLRNRITGRRVKTLAQQQLYSLPSNSEILGVYASNSYLYILGEDFITALKL